MAHLPENFRLLVVDDEQDVREFLSYNLAREGYQVFTAGDGREAVEKAVEASPHLIIMDVMMPVMDGIEACSEIRNRPGLSQTLICFLTARGEDYSQIAGFEAGGDDYIVKPVKPKVLVHRVKALLKRYHRSGEEESNRIISQGNSLVLDRERYLIIRRGEELIVPRKEFELIALLMSKPGKVFTREEIYSKVWGDAVIVGERTIDVHIRKLRERLGEGFIQTLKGVGYKFHEEA
ncbi:MAG: response regulator transcription factor [Bacteroidales bacterium]|nr:response regulator transcription factor [Bacteroidales bacterium]